MRDLILRMVAPTADGDPVTSRVSQQLLGNDEESEAVIGALIDARLVTSDGATVGLAHEALVRAWPRLQDWLDEDTEGQRILRHLTLRPTGGRRWSDRTLSSIGASASRGAGVAGSGQAQPDVG